MVASWMRISVAGLALVAAGLPAKAQAVGTSAQSGISGPVAPHAPRRKPNPYSVTEMTTSVQTLGDGTQIRTQRESRRMMDDEGRMRTEISSDVNQGPRIGQIMINDPVAKVNIVLYPAKKIAQINHTDVMQPTQQWMEEQQEFSKAMAPSQEELQEMQSRGQGQRPSTENLGEMTIAGLRAKGTRSSFVIPAGQMGNDRELRTVSETWMSTEFFMPLRTIRDDPRTGHTETVVTSFDKTPPDPDLFKVPDDYHVFDMKR